MSCLFVFSSHASPSDLNVSTAVAQNDFSSDAVAKVSTNVNTTEIKTTNNKGLSSDVEMSGALTGKRTLLAKQVVNERPLNADYLNSDTHKDTGSVIRQTLGCDSCHSIFQNEKSFKGAVLLDGLPKAMGEKPELESS